jgi:hypothetical protein
MIQLVKLSLKLGLYLPQYVFEDSFELPEVLVSEEGPDLLREGGHQHLL